MALNESEVRKLYLEDGLSIRQVADKLGASTAAVSRFMKKYGIPLRNKKDAQKNYLKDNSHQMKGRKHSDVTKQRISDGLGSFWKGLTPSESQAMRQRIGTAWRNKWDAMSDKDRQTFMSDMAKRSKATQGLGSRLERFVIEQLQSNGFIVEVRSTNYTAGKSFEVDIALPKQKIAIEIDGPTHFLPIYGEEHLADQKDRDARKDELINGAGYHVLRIRDDNGPLSRLRMNKILEAINEIAQDTTPSVWYID